MSPLEWLQSPACSAWGVPVSWAEVLGDVTGAACVWGVARQKLWNWPVGLANNVFWALLFWTSKLYGDALLQGIFFALGVFGWWSWLRRGPDRARLAVRRTTAREWAWLSGSTAAATGLAAWYLAARTDSPVPFWDAAVLTLSLCATWGQTQKLLESWWVWIAVDVISVPLYLSRDLYPTAALYALFGALCLKGLVDWRQSLAAVAAAPS